MRENLDPLLGWADDGLPLACMGVAGEGVHPSQHLAGTREAGVTANLLGIEIANTHRSSIVRKLQASVRLVARCGRVPPFSSPSQGPASARSEFHLSGPGETGQDRVAGLSLWEHA